MKITNATTLSLAVLLASCGGSKSSDSASGSEADSGAGRSANLDDGGASNEQMDQAGASGDDASLGAGGATSGAEGDGGIDAADADAGASRNADGGTAAAMLGVYRWGNLTYQAAYESWLGTNVPVLLSFLPGQDWANQEGEDWWLNPTGSWVAGRVGNTLVMTVEMVLVDNGKDVNSLEECAAGTDNPHWQALAKNMIAHGLDKSILRLGHEFNGNWYPWNAVGRAPTYISCFQQMVTSMRAVAGSHLRFNWCPGAGVANMPAETAYPGDDYVDVIGVDLYDPQFQFVAAKPYTDADRAKGWQFTQNGDHMLFYWRDFAKTHGKPMSFPEWGNDPTSGQYPGPGDDTIYVQGMHDFIVDPTNNVLFASYFDVHASDGDHQLSPGVKGEPGYAPTQYPNSAALFLKLFGK